MLKTCERCGKQKNMMSWESLCYSCTKEKELERIQAAIKAGDDADTYSSDYVICPHCGVSIEASHLGPWDFGEAYEEGDHELTCDECGKSYRLYTTVRYSWETRKM